MRRTLLSWAIGTIIALGCSISVVAQEQPPTPRDLQEMIENIKTLDPDVTKYLPRWRVQEADLKTKLTLFFRSRGVPMRESDTIIVTASFPDPEKGYAQDLLKIRAGSHSEGELNGRAQIETTLGTELYQTILNRKYAHEEIKPETPITTDGADRVASVLYPTDARQFIAVSAFRQAVQLGTTNARLEHLIGNDEIGYHFWSSGQAKVIVDYPVIRLQDAALRSQGVPDIFKVSLGVAYRIKFGQPGDNFVSDVISPRKLNGAIGAKAIIRSEYRLPQVNDIGLAVQAELPFSKLRGFEDLKADEEVAWVQGSLRLDRRTIDDVRTAYFLRTVAQGNLFWETWFDNYEHFLRFSVGVSYQEFARGVIRVGDNYLAASGDRLYSPDGAQLPGPNLVGVGDNVQYTGLVHPTEFADWIYAKAEYLNQSGFPFGGSVQLSNQNLLLTGFIPVVPNWLFLEAKYSTPLLREEPAPWENNTFVMISPILRFKL